MRNHSHHQGARRWTALASVLFPFFLAGGASADESDDHWARLIREVRTSVVMVSVSHSVALGADPRGFWTGTGFVADVRQGLVVTAQHIAGRSPYSNLVITFSNGDSLAAKVRYYDPWHDFAILQYDPSDLSESREPPTEVRLGVHDDLELGQTLLLVGNSSGEGLSAKLGQVSGLFVLKAPNSLGRHSHHFHVSLARNGGSSGSPVFDQEGRVVGLHTSGIENESFELRIDYVADALKALREGRREPRRGDLGIVLETMACIGAVHCLGVSAHIVEAAKGVDPELLHVLVVKERLPGSKAYEELQPGDVIVSVRGKNDSETVILAEDAYRFDRLVDAHVGETMEIVVFRDQRQITVELPVMDARSKALRRFAVFCGATFHEVPVEVALRLDRPPQGIFLSETEPGTTFSRLGYALNEEGKRAVVLTKIGMKRIESLDDFVASVSNLQSGEQVPVWFHDLNSFDINEGFSLVDIDSRYSPLSGFVWNEERLEWMPMDGVSLPTPAAAGGGIGELRPGASGYAGHRAPPECQPR